MKTHILFGLIIGIIHTTISGMFVEPSRAIRVARVTTAARFAEELYDATINGRIDTIERLAQEPLANINRRFTLGCYRQCTLLLLAVSMNDSRLCEVLLKHGAYVHARSAEWKGNECTIVTPIRAACGLGFADIVALLAQYGAYVNDTEKIGISPIHYAALDGNSSVVKPLYDAKADLNEQDVNGATALHLAASNNDLPMAQTLLEFGAAPDTIDSAGFTPLHYAQQYEYKEMVNLLRTHSYGPELTSQLEREEESEKLRDYYYSWDQQSDTQIQHSNTSYLALSPMKS